MPSDKPFVPTRWQSLRWRLPATMAVLVAITLAVVLVVAYREVQQTLLDAAGNRTRAAAEQIGRLATGPPSLTGLRQSFGASAVALWRVGGKSANGIRNGASGSRHRVVRPSRW